MKVAEIMARHVEFIEASATVQDAARMMAEMDVGALPVGRPEELQGILTDRDIILRVVALGLDGPSARVADVMSTMIFSCREDDPVEVAMALMGARHVRRVPVLNAAGEVVGWLALSDISRRLLLESDVMRTALQEISGATAS
jgi:CBS domain-containing protein